MASLPILLLLSLAPGQGLLHVSRNTLLQGTVPVHLRGVNVPSLEWSNEGERVFRSCRVAIEEWKANCIRLPLSQDRWFGKAEGQEGKGDDYRTLIDQVSSYVSNSNAYLILDLHWSDEGEWGKNLGQHKMPDKNSEAFWKEAAHKFRGNDHVLLGLYNEPHDVDWKTWLDGGPVQENGKTFEAVGMKRLLQDVRSVSAKNVVVVGGLDWAYDLTGAAELVDTSGNGVLLDAHIYPWKKDWDRFVGKAAETSPVIVGEAGCIEDPKQEKPVLWAPKLFSWMSNKRLNWTAWCMHPTATPNLISDWSYTPTPFWGAYVKEALNR